MARPIGLSTGWARYHPMEDWHCPVRGCTRDARQPTPAPSCPVHPNVQMKRGKR